MLGNPVLGEDFHDREELLNRLIHRIDRLIEGHRSHAALIGPRKAGKTSILFRLKDLCSDKGVFPLYIYVKPEPSRIFIARFLASLLAEFLRSRNLPVEEIIFPHQRALQGLIRRCVPLLPQTAAKVLEIQETDSSQEAFLSLFLLLGVFQRETGLPMVVMLDEFQRLGHYQIPDVFDHFRETMATQERVMYIIAGSAVGMMMDLVTAKTAPLFGHFEIHPVGNFDYADARSFLLAKTQGRVALKESHLDFLIDLTEGFPFYLDVLANRIVLLAAVKGVRKAPRSLILTALSEEVFSEAGTIYQYLRETVEESISRRGLGTYLTILSAIAQGHHSVSQLARATGMQMPAIPHYLRRLLEARLIYRRRKAYFISDNLLAFWLKYVYALTEESYVSELGVRLEHFQRQVEQMLMAYRSELGLAREAQIRELFAQMNEFVEVRGGYWRGSEFDLIAIQPDGQVWLGEVKTDVVDKGDVLKFAEKATRAGDEEGVVKRIMFALGGHNAAAVEAAAATGVEIWSLSQVNAARRRFHLRRMLL